MNEFLLAFFIPAIIIFVTVWVVARLYLDQLLRGVGLGPVRPDPVPFVAVQSGLGRFLFLVVVTAGLLLGYVVVYLRLLRGPLRDRDIV